MENAAVQGIKELIEEGTPVEYLEGDGDNTLIARLKTEMGLSLKKRFDRNHVVKNIGKSLSELQKKKSLKLSKGVIMHLQKCVKYAFAKNHGNPEAFEKNLLGLIPHQFGDHTQYEAEICGFKRNPTERNRQQTLSYKSALKNPCLQNELNSLFQPIIGRAHVLSDVGSSQQCEHANQEVALRAPKSHFHGCSESLYFRVHATATFINEGRHYISKVLP
jgi:hypothetical protein